MLYMCLCYPKAVYYFVDVSKVQGVLQQHYHASINDTILSVLLPNEEVDGSFMFVVDAWHL